MQQHSLILNPAYYSGHNGSVLTNPFHKCIITETCLIQNMQLYGTEYYEICTQNSRSIN